MAPLPLAGANPASPASASKKTVSSLLPAFEPFSSSPALPRPLKRNRDAFDEKITYPTPVPTSSTAILTSSPPHVSVPRPSFVRVTSTLSERAPLATVPSIMLHADGKVTRMGRSSASCDYQFSSNRLISRVHVSTCFKPAGSRLERDRIEVTCSGWNGIKIHCQGKVYDLKKGETFASDIRDAEVMIDVQDNRVVVKWPEKPLLGPMSSDEEEESPAKKQRAMRRHSTPPSPSPLQSRRRPVSPISPSPAVQALLPSSPPVHPARAPADTVQIYEDPEPTQGIAREDESVEISQATQILSQNVHSTQSPSQSNLFSPKDEFSDNDEENDPIVHSFGPFGANLLPRMASFNATGSPRASSTKTSRSSHTEPLHLNDSPAQPTSQPIEFDIRGHIINQLAFSRLSSTPLSTIFNHLPRDAGVVTKTDLKNFINETQCIGEVVREGKDAAGKPLESEYYYIPDQDEDEKRKEAVVTDLMKPGLRACRKQHKQYFWRKPK